MKGDYNVSELLIFIVLGLILFSCGNKEQVSTNPLIGKWVNPDGFSMTSCRIDLSTGNNMKKVCDIE